MSTQVLHHEPAQSAEPSAAGGLAAQTSERRAKRGALRARGINPYPTRFDRGATLAELQSAQFGLEPDTRTGEVARVAGRVVSMRGHGKLRFITIEDASGTVQLMFQARRLPADAAAVEALVDLGDWVGAAGEVITSRRGELSVDVTGLRVGVIGTGSSGVQSIPVLARAAAHLTVFQRTPNFSVPAMHAAITDEQDAAVKADYAGRRARICSGLSVRSPQRAGTASGSRAAAPA